jgi:5-(carboxyamino)imidazole ribonucleotide synthase
MTSMTDAAVRADKKTIGIIGGGQLGQMMAVSAQYMGHRVVTLDPNPLCSASKVSDEMIVAEYDDIDAIRLLACKSDVLTYEFENVDAAALRAVLADPDPEVSSVSIPQGVEMLEITQNRRSEKEFVESVLVDGSPIRVAPWKLVRSAADLPSHVTKKQVLKTTTGGYDGHGQVVLKSDADLVEARDLADHAECELEDFISFRIEISVVVSGNGHDFVTFPVCENDHRDEILHRTIAPARISDSVADRARRLALAIAAQLHLAGTMCVEMFLTDDDNGSGDGEIYVNELAPRPHNSGHYTIEACDFSQFDLHIKGILGEPLPQPRLLSPAIMLNVLGQHVEGVAALPFAHPDWHLHDYGKLEVKHNRKMGHVTILVDDRADGNVSFDATLAQIDATHIWD